MSVNNDAINNFAFDCLHMKPVKLTSLFDVIEHENSKLHYSETNDGEYPYVGSVSAHNNMIVKYVDYYDLDGDYICVNPVPPAIGMCTVHHRKIAVQRNVIVLQLKHKFEHLTSCLSCIAGNLSQYFHLKYLKCFRINEQQIQNELVPRVPFIQSTDDPHKMVIDTEGLKYAFNFWSSGCDDSEIWYNPAYVGMKLWNIGEIFDDINCSDYYKLDDLKPGPYPLLQCGSVNNGIKCFVDKWTNEGDYITVPRTGSVGYCFAQHGKFCIKYTDRSLQLLQLKPEYKHLTSCLTLLAYWMTKNFVPKYNYSTKLNNARLMKETISLPVVVRGLTPEQEQQISNKEITIEQLTNNFTSDQFEYELNENLMNWFCWKWFI